MSNSHSESPSSATKSPGHLIASRHRENQECVFPAVPSNAPAASLYEPVQLSKTATLYSFTVIHPSSKSQLPPFVLAYADFPEGARVMGRLKLPAGTAPKIGMKLAICLTTSAENAVDFHFTSADGT